MLKEEILSEFTVLEYAQFKEFIKNKPPVFGTDSEGQPRREYAATDVHEFLQIMRGANGSRKEDQAAGQDLANQSSVGEVTQALPARSEVAS